MADNQFVLPLFFSPFRKRIWSYFKCVTVFF